MSGVWRYSRQANYLGEGLFWLANYGAGQLGGCLSGWVELGGALGLGI